MKALRATLLALCLLIPPAAAAAPDASFLAGAGQARALRTVQAQLAGGEGIAELPENTPLLGIVVETPDPATGLAQVMVSLR